MTLKETVKGLETRLDQFIISNRGQYIFPGSKIIEEMRSPDPNSKQYGLAMGIESAKLVIYTGLINLLMEAYFR